MPTVLRDLEILGCVVAILFQDGGGRKQSLVRVVVPALQGSDKNQLLCLHN
jgi:hypothetical protein